MASFRSLKQCLKKALSQADWKDSLEKLAAGTKLPASGSADGAGPLSAVEALGPLMGFLPLSGNLHWRAVYSIGFLTARLAEGSPHNLERARNIMRRFMWHMNEESGNIGWGIPQSMGETLAQSAPLADEFGRILVSYVIDTGGDDNYVEHPPLLACCFWAVGRLAEARPELVAPHLASLTRGLLHESPQVAAQACLALHKLLFPAAGAGGNPPARLGSGPAPDRLDPNRLDPAWLDPSLLDPNRLASARPLQDLRVTDRLLELAHGQLTCEDFDGNQARTRQVRRLAEEILAAGKSLFRN